MDQILGGKSLISGTILLLESTIGSSYLSIFSPPFEYYHTASLSRILCQFFRVIDRNAASHVPLGWPSSALVIFAVFEFVGIRCLLLLFLCQRNLPNPGCF